MAERKISEIPSALIVACGLMLAAAVGAYFFKPRHMIANDKPTMDLPQIVPSAFGNWRQDDSLPPITPDPTVQAKLDALYSQTLNRSYVNKAGDHIMISIAYGKNQNSQSTAAHRPEFCYNAQGFNIENLGYKILKLQKRALKTVRLVADRDDRIEPITYWVTLNEEAIVPGIERKLTQLKYGMQGMIVDGMLVRISSLTRDKKTPDFSTHQQFLLDLEKALPEGMKSRFMGS